MKWLRDRFMTEWNLQSNEGKIKMAILTVIAVLIVYNLVVG